MTMTKYPITCIQCEDYLGDFSSDQEVKEEGHIILDMSGDEATVMCVTCNNPKISIDNINLDNFFHARDEIIDVYSDIEDHLSDEGSEMKLSVLTRITNGLRLLDELRKELGIPDREYVADE